MAKPVIEPLAFTSAVEIGRRIGRREISPVEVVQDALDRIERIDPKLNSYILVLADRALAEARAAEAEIAVAGQRGPFHGVPVALKDIFDTAGIVTANGCKVFADRVPSEDAEVVRRLRQAGTILLGKLNMHEIASGITTNNVFYGPTRNPWNTERVPSGSSGGSGAALAAGLCHLSLGTDTGGSIRLPAGACGIVGLKPTFGRVSRRGVYSLSWTLDHVGPMTRTVEDTAVLLNALAGHDPGDLWSATEPVENFGADLRLGVRGLRIGVPREFFFDQVEPDVERSVRAAIAHLEREGATLVDVSLPNVARSPKILSVIIRPEATAYHAHWLETRPEDFSDDARERLTMGHFVSAVDYVNARRAQTLIRGDFEAALKLADVLAMPTMPRTSPAIGVDVSPPTGPAWNDFMGPLNIAGLPAISVPCGFGDDGLPIGLQIAGRAWDERTVLRVAAAYEGSTEWHRQHPPLATANA